MKLDNKFYIFLTAIIVIIGGFAGVIAWKLHPVNKLVQTYASQTNQPAASGAIREFISAKYGFQFQYPTVWGNVQSTEEKPDQKTIEGDKFLSHVDLSKATSVKNYMLFEKKPCSSDAYCSIAIVVQEYDPNHPEEFFCYAGSCEIHTNILEEKEEIEANPAIMIGGHKGSVRDEYFKDGEIFNRIYTVITGNYELSIIASYDSSDFSPFLREDKEGTIPLEQVIEKNPNAPHNADFKQFLETMNQFVGSFAFSAPAA